SHRMLGRRSGSARARLVEPLSHSLRSALERPAGARSRLPDRRTSARRAHQWAQGARRVRARALLGLGAALLSAACAFWSDRAFFAESEAVQPFESGARFVWREGGGGESQTIVFTRAGAGYVLQDVNEPDDKPIEMMLVALPETPEEDFIAQVTLPNAEGVRAYAFLWSAGDGYRMLAAPRALDGLASAEPVL